MRILVAALLIFTLSGCSGAADITELVAKPSDLPAGWGYARFDEVNESLEFVGATTNPGYGDVSSESLRDQNMTKFYVAHFVNETAEGQFIASYVAEFETAQHAQEFVDDYCQFGGNALRSGKILSFLSVEADGGDEIIQQIWASMMARTSLELACLDS